MPDRAKVLIVDDEAGFVRLLKMNLEDTGLFVVRAEHSGENGLKAARGFRPDVILLDVTMGDMSGDRFAEILKADEELRSIPIVFVTAAPPQKRETLKRAAACIGKPAGTDEIVKCILANVFKNREGNGMP